MQVAHLSGIDRITQTMETLTDTPNLQGDNLQIFGDSLAHLSKRLACRGRDSKHRRDLADNCRLAPVAASGTEQHCKPRKSKLKPNRTSSARRQIQTTNNAGNPNTIRTVGTNKQTGICTES